MLGLPQLTGQPPMCAPLLWSPGPLPRDSLPVLQLSSTPQSVPGARPWEEKSPSLLSGRTRGGQGTARLFGHRAECDCEFGGEVRGQGRQGKEALIVVGMEEIREAAWGRRVFEWGCGAWAAFP